MITAFRNLCRFRSRWLAFACVAALMHWTKAHAQDTDADAEELPVEDAADAASRFGNFLAIPVFITEPAIGEGLGLGLVYFHKVDDKKNQRLSTPSSLSRTARKQKPPPTATGVFGFYTSNETQGVGIGHAGSYMEDRLRLVGALASMEVNAALFLLDVPFNFTIDGNLAYANFKRRLGTSNVFLGLSAMALDADVSFDIGPDAMPPRDLLNFSTRNIGLAGSAIFDGRDDSMMPGDGHLYDLTVWRYDEAFGSDVNYWSARFKANYFRPIGERWNLGLRFDVSTVSGDPPFFAIPFVSLRGIPALRYQAETAGVIEAEGRYNISPRWAAVAFAGAGLTRVDDEPLDTEDDIYAWGAGIRFQALREQNVWVGLDVARGPEEVAWYIQVGHAW